MGREVRMVPADWQHPEEWNPYRRQMDHKPLLKGPFSESLATWERENQEWANGNVRDYSRYSENVFKPKDDSHTGSFEDYYGERPQAEKYMPEWPADKATYLMMYETCSEGTPISPAFATAEGLARWLADNGASSFGSDTASYEAWLATIKRGWAISAIIDNNGLRSGVEAMADEA